MRKLLLALSLLAASSMSTSCAPTKPLPTEPFVALDRFMGDWYVQGHIPFGSEKKAYNGVESYALDEKGRVLTTYAYRKGAFDGKVKIAEPVGFVVDGESNAEWGMRFIWPFKAEFLIAHVDDDYTETIIARSKRDYAWIMTRDPVISEERFDALVARLEALEYDVSEVRRVPQRWPDPGHPVSDAGGNLARFTRGR